MRPFDIAPFGLPNCPPGEVRFEEPRDVERVVVVFADAAPRRAALSYLRRTWPEHRFERNADMDLHCPARLGWMPSDDHFNTEWQRAAVNVERVGGKTIVFTFKGLCRELGRLAAARDYDVTFRRTLGLRVGAGGGRKIRRIQVFTVSPPARTRLRVELDAGRKTRSGFLELSGYNAVVRKLEAGRGVTAEGGRLRLRSARKRVFHVEVEHMRPAGRWSRDDGHVSFSLEREMFTISLAALARDGPIWFAEEGVYVAQAEDPTTFADYRARIKGAKTVLAQVEERPEQSLGGAIHGQPRPHADAFALGCKHARQRFRVEPNGDVVVHRRDVACGVPGKDTGRVKTDGDGRFFFGLERWIVAARFGDAGSVLACNIHLRQGEILLEQKAFAVPLTKPILTGQLAGDDTVCALVRFRLTNTGDRPARAELPVAYSHRSDRSRARPNLLAGGGQGHDDWLVPRSPRDRLEATNGRITSRWHGRKVLRCAYQTGMDVARRGQGVLFSQKLRPGEACEVLLKIPHVALESPDELAALEELDFDDSYRQVRAFWRKEAGQGAQVKTPEPILDALHALHPAVVNISDFAMPDDADLVNTSVGTSTYGNFANESCMILEDLDQRGMHQDARRRLDVWVKYQGTVGLEGNFSDHEGVYFGAGGFEAGRQYNQHHGWVLWRLADHYLYTRDRAWFERIADSLVSAAEWVFRQRRSTMKDLAHSRGWERGFLPAGGLEDVGDYHYWLSTNALTWRGTDACAQAMEAYGHPQAGRIREASDAYRDDLITGFETARRHAPLVRLRDGRWVPTYPSRLYNRGRDLGWIREVLEGSVYLLISGLYGPHSRQAGWILEDYQDNRYMSPPFGYALVDAETEWFDRGGFSIQPCLLAGLLPHLDRDEPEVYIWMFFNAWASCYRQEIGAMVEHPMPVLGFSNSVPYKTSDQSNAVKWLRYMFVYCQGDVLHLGRAVPREWFRHAQEIGAERVATHFGQVSVRYRSADGAGRITARVDLALRRDPSRILVRFRHPDSRPIRAALVNGAAAAFDAVRGNVELTGRTGHLVVEAHYLE